MAIYKQIFSKIASEVKVTSPAEVIENIEGKTIIFKTFNVQKKKINRVAEIDIEKYLQSN